MTDDDSVHWYVLGQEVPFHEPVPPSSDELPYRLGTRFADRYDLRGLLGAGSVGAVYRAWDDATDRVVALKLLRERVHEEDKARLRREGELTSSLDHPGIVKVLEIGEHEGVPYLAYELIEGRSFDYVIGRLDLRLSVRVVRDVAEALGYAHRQGVIHRDVKPGNVILDDSGRPMLADFGLGWKAGVATLTQSDALLGTPVCMAPEQIDPRRGEVGPYSDVWALGVILYQCLTRRRPFDAPGLVGLMESICAASPTRPRWIEPSLSEELEAVCLKALSLEPDDRYTNGTRFAEALDPLVDLAD